MKSDNDALRVQIDTYTRACLTVLAVLLTVVVIGLWSTHVPDAETASAADPRIYGPTKQRETMIKQQKETNEKLSQLLKFVKSGRLTVQIADDTAEKSASGGKKTGDGNDGKIIIRKTDR